MRIPKKRFFFIHETGGGDIAILQKNGGRTQLGPLGLWSAPDLELEDIKGNSVRRASNLGKNWGSMGGEKAKTKKRPNPYSGSHRKSKRRNS